MPSDTPFNLSTASSLNGTHLDEPFLVVGKKAAFLLKSICSQRNPSISPRLIAVSTARTTIGQRYHDLDFSAATLSLSSSLSFNLRSLGGLFLASYSGLVISIYPYMVPPSITIWQKENKLIMTLALELARDTTSPSIKSFVAKVNERVIGYVSYSPIYLKSDTGISGYILAPLAVSPQHQKQGVGSELVQRGIDVLTKEGG